MTSGHGVFLFHTDNRWLWCGRVLTRVFELRAEITHFPPERRSDLVQTFSFKLLALWAYLPDIAVKRNLFSRFLERRSVCMVTANEKIRAYQWTLIYGHDQWVVNSSLISPKEEEDEERKVDLQAVQTTMVGEIMSQLPDLKKASDGYFGRDIQRAPWIQSPFEVPEDVMDVDHPAEREFIKLRSITVLEEVFRHQNLEEFWVTRMEE